MVQDEWSNSVKPREMHKKHGHERVFVSKILERHFVVVVARLPSS